LKITVFFCDHLRIGEYFDDLIESDVLDFLVFDFHVIILVLDLVLAVDRKLEMSEINGYLGLVY